MTDKIQISKLMEARVKILDLTDELGLTNSEKVFLYDNLKTKIHTAEILGRTVYDPENEVRKKIREERDTVLSENGKILNPSHPDDLRGDPVD